MIPRGDRSALIGRRDVNWAALSCATPTYPPARRRPVQIASLRYTWVMDEAIRARARAADDPRAEQERGAKGLWSWIDIRDAASACRLALWRGHERFWINAADTILDLPIGEAVAKWYPACRCRRRCPATPPC